MSQSDGRNEPIRYSAIVVGMVLGHLAGSSSVTLAKVILLLNGERGYTPGRLAESSLHMILVVAAASACIGVVAALRGIVGFQEVLTAALSAAIFGFIVIVDYGVPGPDGSVQLPLCRTIYYFGWIVALWFSPFVFLPTRDKRFSIRVRQGCEVLLVTTAMTIAGVLVGLLLEEVSERLLPAIGSWMGGAVVAHPRYFWVALPATLNATVGAYAGVAFLNLWWPGRWHSSRSAWLWTLGVTAFAVPYAGLYGAAFFDRARAASGWHAFLAFGGMGLAASLGVLAAYLVTRLAAGVPAPRVAGSRAFGWILPVCLSSSFGLTAWLGLASLAESDALSTKELMALVVAHGVNGAIMGVTLLLILKIVELAKGRAMVQSRL